MKEIESIILKGLSKDEELTDSQKEAVKSSMRKLLIVAGAGSGKTEVMARRIAWWVGVEKIPKERIVAFTFTERAASELKFRIRSWIERITPEGEEASLGDMYVGTIHGFCLAKIREYWPDKYHNYDILDESGRAALALRGFNNLLGLQAFRSALSEGGRYVGQYATMESFFEAYDQLHEHDRFEIELPEGEPPIHLGEKEKEWCKLASLTTNVGDTPAALAFARSAARYYAYLRCRRFLDFSTSQTEFIRNLDSDSGKKKELEEKGVCLVVDEVQDINPVQMKLIELLVGKRGRLTAVGDHRQAIYGFRGAKVEIIAKLWERFKKEKDSDVKDLQENFRSTPRIINLSNAWADTILPLRSMKTLPMMHGKKQRQDHHPSHVALIGFDDRTQEANWIGEAVRALVPSEHEGAWHDKKTDDCRGLSLSDIAVLVRSSTDVRVYMQALESAGIPAIVRAGPDLFSQPEVLLMVSALAITAGHEEFWGSEINPKSMVSRIRAVLNCDVKPEIVLKESAKLIRRSGLSFDRKTEDRLLFAAKSIHRRISEGVSFKKDQVAGLRSHKLREFLTSNHLLRRVFPQQLFHYLMTEAAVDSWDTCEGRGQTALFHLGALSGLITGIETPGWTSTDDYKWQVIGLFQYGAEEGRTAEQPLMVQPDAVTISTIHGVKGLQFAAVFMADVCARRFPSGFARRVHDLPLSGEIVREIDVAGLADNENYDGERRLMYVALTRAERFLIISHSGRQTSQFIKQLNTMVEKTGGTVTEDSNQILHDLKYAPKEYRRELQLSTSFSDIRYYLECPHDFYLRKVLGFAPTIDQAFGYGRGVHNILRAIHSDPKRWAGLVGDRPKLEKEIQKLIDKGLFYLRYTTGDPAENMRTRGLQIVADYVQRYAEELSLLRFEPEKNFETLIEYEDGEGGALISGAIDVIRQDDPPRVTIIDFKSGDSDSDKHQKLDEDEMKLQVAIYAAAAKRELEYRPELGLVRYLGAEEGGKTQLEVPLTGDKIDESRSYVSRTVAQIRDRSFKVGPTDTEDEIRCNDCDFIGLCGMDDAFAFKKQA